MITTRFKPKFWDHQDAAAGPFKSLFNFRRIWKQAAFLTAGVALIPLIFMAIIDYNVTQDAIESEILLRTSRLVSNTRRSISFFLDERKFALNFIIHDNTPESLKNPDRLSAILENLKKSLGGFSDLGVIDESGVQINYVGPYDLIGVDYGTQAWYREVLERNIYISDVFLGLRNVPHFVIAVKHGLPDGSFFVLRSSLDMERFKELLSELEVGGMGDAFIINQDGILQTPSRYQTTVLERIPLSVPEYSSKTIVYQTLDRAGKILIVGYAYITDTPFVLIVTKQKAELMKPWFKTRSQLIGFLAVSIITILVVVIGVSTYLVNNIFLADQKRVMTLHQVEYANKLASIGRLAAGVAHEINNPLAIINEKAGLIKDIFTFQKNYVNDSKLNSLVDSIIASVERCGTITKRLLNFARHIEVSVQKLSVKSIIQDVLGFMGKEAEYKSITISVDIPDDIPDFESDRGKLQQIFLNLINNAFAAMADGGRLEIRVSRRGEDAISIEVADDGCGISESDIKRVFEPFFTTKSRSGGTGLGLSITYGLVQEIGGKIQVQSAVGKGTRFTIMMPLNYTKKKGEGYARIAG
ncbi:MAG: ATP-binding protein [Deltaproteobacteria bacterium]|nr:ATP-binding protein [Deltaproteobacteria bacterium]